MKKVLATILSVMITAAAVIVPTSAEQSPTKMGIKGTFMQSYLYGYLSEDRIANEFAEMHKAGIETIIMGDSAIMAQGSEEWSVNYPSTLDEFKDVQKDDRISILLKYCQKYDMNLYLGIGTDQNFFNPLKDLNIPSNMKWFKDRCTLCAKVAREIHDLYDQYGDTFAGYYWGYELNNSISWDFNGTREAYVNGISEAMNIVLDAINTFDTKRPLIFSPYGSETGAAQFPRNFLVYSSIDNLTNFYTDLINKTHFRSQDAIAPMDNVGGGGQNMDTFEKWIGAYYKAIENSNHKIQFWDNCENFRPYPNEEHPLTQVHFTPATLDNFVKQLDVANKYCSNIICFSWHYYYSPYNTDPGFQKSYLHYLETGELETVAPSLPDSVTVTGSVTANITVSGFTDDYGISSYRLSTVDGDKTKVIKQNYVSFYDYGDVGSKELLSREFKDVTLNIFTTNYFMLEAIDCTGNISKIYIPVKGINASDRTDFPAKGYYTEEEYNQIIKK